MRNDYWTVGLDKRSSGKEYDCIYKDIEPAGFVLVSPPQMVNNYDPFNYNYEDSASKGLKKIL